MSENTENKETNTDDSKDKKPRFTAEQIVQINKIRDDALAAERQRLQDEWQRKLDEQKAELERKIAEAQKPAPKQEEKKDDKAPVADPEVATLKASFEELKNMFKTVKTEKETIQQQLEREKEERRLSRRKDQFLGALPQAKVDFYDPLEAYELAVKEGLEYDDTKDRVVIKSAQTGAPKLNENGEPMGVIDFIKDFASRKKYLVKAPTQDGGTGSGEQRRMESKDDNAVDYSKMSDEEFEKLRQSIMSKR